MKQHQKNEAIAALHQLKEEGKIRAIGVSNFSLEQLKEANQDGYVDIVEERYSLIHRELEEELFPYLKEKRISFVSILSSSFRLIDWKISKRRSF